MAASAVANDDLIMVFLSMFVLRELFCRFYQARRQAAIRQRGSSRARIELAAAICYSAAMIRNRNDWLGITFSAVVPAQAGTHIPEAVVMGPRFRGDDSFMSSSFAVGMTCQGRP